MNSTKKISIFSLFLLVLIGCFGCNESQINWDEFDDSVVRVVVTCYLSTGEVVELCSGGTAFSVNENGNFVTNFHVVAVMQEKKLLVLDEHGKKSEKEILKTELNIIENKETKHPANVIWYSNAPDLAILQVESFTRVPIPLGDAKVVFKHQNVTSIGFPGASDLAEAMNPAYFEPKVKAGVISSPHSYEAVELFEHDATINGGNSGGPLVDECGRVVGINVMSSNIGEGTFWAIQVDELVKVLKEQNIPFQFDGTPCHAQTQQNLTSIYAFMVFMFLSFVWIIWQLRKIPGTPKEKARVVSQWVHDKIVPKSANKSNMEQNNMPGYVRGENGEIIGGPEKHDIPSSTNIFTLNPGRTIWPVIEVRPGKIYRIGRVAGQVDFVIANDVVSRFHVQIRVDTDKGLQVMDMDTTNGTYCDSQKIPNNVWYTMQSGQQLILGQGHDQVVYDVKLGN